MKLTFNIYHKANRPFSPTRKVDTSLLLYLSRHFGRHQMLLILSQSRNIPNLKFKCTVWLKTYLFVVIRCINYKLLLTGDSTILHIFKTISQHIHHNVLSFHFCLITGPPFFSKLHAVIPKLSASHSDKKNRKKIEKNLRLRSVQKILHSIPLQ